MQRAASTTESFGAIVRTSRVMTSATVVIEFSLEVEAGKTLAHGVQSSDGVTAPCRPARKLA